MPERGSRHAFWASFGPGLLWAAAAIGVSHLVQSTRAGAMAGYGLVGVMLAALVLKYPFFEFGPRYAAATGASLVEGYRRLGRWALWLYLGITLATALIVQAAVVLFTSYLVQRTFGLPWSLPVVGAVVCSACAALIAVGRFRALDATIKAVMVLLAVSTLVAAGVTLGRTDLSTLALIPPVGGERGVRFAFLLALVGWMPSAIDISVWSSLWTLAKDGVLGYRSEARLVLLDFRIGYVGTGIMAFAFLTLGATVMYGTGTEFSPAGTAFASQLVDLYTGALGSWTRPVVLTAVLTTMFSTSLTVIDGFPRAIDRSVRVLLREELPGASGTPDPGGTTRAYWIALVALGAGTVAVFALVIGSLTAMVDFATIVSFLTAPVLGYLNLRAVTAPEVPPGLRPGPRLRALAWVGLVVLGGFAVGYVISRLR